MAKKFLDHTTPAARVNVASQLSLDRAYTPPPAEEGSRCRTFQSATIIWTACLSRGAGCCDFQDVTTLLDSCAPGEGGASRDTGPHEERCLLSVSFLTRRENRHHNFRCARQSGKNHELCTGGTPDTQRTVSNGLRISHDLDSAVSMMNHCTGDTT